MANTIYDFSVKDQEGNPTSLKEYEGKVVLIINTATKCGLTPQYEALENLYQKYHDQGFEILDFPCNQFMKQAPGTATEINEFCSLKFHTTFPRFEKIDVNGDDADPLFVWLKEQKPEDKGDAESESFDKKVKLLKPFSKKGDIKWNFGKFLVNKKGEVVERFSPGYTPEKLEPEIEALLKES